MKRRWLAVPLGCVFGAAVWWVQSVPEVYPPTSPAVAPAAALPAAPAPDAEHYLVRVFDQDGEPVEGAGISWRENRQRQIRRTGPDGTLRLPAGQDLKIYGLGGAVLVDDPEEGHFTLSARAPQADFFVPERCSLAVTVTDWRGHPLRASVGYISHGSGVSVNEEADEDGRVTLTSVPCEPGELYVVEPEYAPEAIPIAGGDNRLLVQMAPVREVTLQVLGRTGGRAVDAHVREEGSIWRSNRVEPGVFSVPVNTHTGTTLEISAVGYWPVVLPLSASGPDRVTVALEPDPTAGFRAYDRGEGLVVSAIDPEGPAAEGGLMKGDTLVEGWIAGFPVGSRASALAGLAALPMGVPVAVEVERGGRRQVVRW